MQNITAADMIHIDEWTDVREVILTDCDQQELDELNRLLAEGGADLVGPPLLGWGDRNATLSVPSLRTHYHVRLAPEA